MASKEPWWYEYRRRKNPPRIVINVENAICDIFRRCYKEFINNCSIPGVRHLHNPNITLIERILLMFVFGFMIGIVIYFFWYIWFDSFSNPLIVSMESLTYPISKIDFPAVAICNVNRISKKAMLEFEKNVYNRTPQKNFADMKTWHLGRLIDFSYDESVERFLTDHVVENGGKYGDKMIDAMKYLAPRCEDMLLTCSWGGKIVDCKSIFHVRRTSRGHCCAFNYLLDYNSVGKPNRTNAEVKRQTKPGVYYGLNVILDPLIEDYAYTTGGIQGLEILLFNPMHFADVIGGRMTHRFAEPNTMMYMELNSIKQYASRDVRLYNLETRRCLFYDEQKEKFNNMFSYSSCILDCRIKTVQSLCRCTPYFLPSSSDLPTCTLNDLKCLNKHLDTLLFMYPFGYTNVEGLELELLTSLYCPYCYPDCEFTKHMTRSSKLQLTQTKDVVFDNQYRSHLPTGFNMTGKCIVSIYQSTFYGTLDHMEVVAYWYELVSNFGGVGGVLIGLSFLCIFEFIYFFIVKFIILVIKKFFF